MISLFAAENTPGTKDKAVERTRQEIKMLDDLYKNAIVLINEHYVNKPSDFPAATAGKALFAAMNKNGWRCHVVEIWMQVGQVPQLRSRRRDDVAPRPHGRCPEGSVRSC